MAKGYIPIRRGIQDHLHDASLSLLDLGVYTAILLQANYETGVWRGSAPRIAAEAPRGISLVEVQSSLRNLEKIRFIKRFRTQGARGNYITLINKYEPMFGKLKGMRLNADISTSWEYPVYESITEDETENQLRTNCGPTEPQLTPNCDPTENQPIPKTKEKTKTKNTTSEPFVLPQWVPSENWIGYEEMRKAIKKPMTDRARRMAVKDLDKLRSQGHQPADVLDQSVKASWSGLYELKNKPAPQGTGRSLMERVADDRKAMVV